MPNLRKLICGQRNEVAIFRYAYSLVSFFNTRFLLGVFCIVLLTAQSVQAQERQDDIMIDIQHYGTENGLSHNHVYQSFVDSRGFIWLLTANGLVFFDGAIFMDVLSWTISERSVRYSIQFEDRDGNLWLRMPAGSVVEYKWINIHTFSVSGVPPFWLKTSIGCVFDVASGSDGSLLTCSYDGVLSRQDKEGHIRELFREPGNQFVFVHPGYNDEIIWLTTQTSGDGGWNIWSVGYDGTSTSFRTSRNRVIASAKDGYCHVFEERCYAILEHGKPLKFNMISEKFSAFIPEKEYHFNGVGLTPDSRQCWLLNNGKLYLWDMLNGNYVDIGAKSGKMAPKLAFHILADRSDRAIVSTINGLYLINLKESKFRKLLWVSREVDSRETEKPCRGIFRHSSGRIFINAGRGMYIMDTGSGEIARFRDDFGNYALAEDIDGSLISALSAVHRIDYRSGRILETKEVPSAGFELIWSILPQKNRIWFGGSNGLLYWDRHSGGGIRQYDRYNGFNDLLNSEVYYMEEKPGSGGSMILIASSTGIYELNERDGVLRRYFSGGKGRYYLPCDNIRHFSRDAAGSYWITASTGLVYWNPDFGETRMYNLNDGLLNLNLYAVYPDEYGNIWFSSDDGVCQFQISTGKMRNYGIMDGVTNPEFNRISHFKSPDGTIYFGSVNGVTVFHPRDFTEAFRAEAESAVYLTGARINSRKSGEETDILSAYYSLGKITMQPGDTYLGLRFSVPEFNSHDGVTFMYRIENFGENWRELKSNELQLASLPYHDYTLVVRARTRDGSFRFRDMKLRIEVRPPFYMTLWFLVLLLLLSSVIVYGYFRFRLRSLRDRKEELEREVAIRTEKILRDKILIEQQALELRQKEVEKAHFFTNITHELRTPLTLILGPVKKVVGNGNIGRQNKDLLEIALRSAGRLLRLVNDVLRFASLEEYVPDVSIKEVDTNEFLQNIVADFRSVAVHKKIVFRVRNKMFDDTKILTDPVHLGTILTNLLSNAFKYTSAGGSVLVEAARESGKIRITVSDTGRGIHPDDLPHIFNRYFQTRQESAPAEGGVGIGLALSRELAILLGGEIEAESEQGRGSRFNLLLTDTTLGGAYVGENISVLEVAGTSGLTASQLIFKKWETGYDTTDSVPRLLIAEDDLDLSAFMESVLGEYYELIQVMNGEEALSYLNTNPAPDLIISDVMMPNMDGFQLLERLKADERYRYLPVLILTARATDPDRLTALNLGVDGYLTKPFSETLLIAEIEAIIGRKPPNKSASEHAHVSSSVLTEEDQKWLKELERTVVGNLKNPEYNIDLLAQSLFMSRTIFFEKIKKLTGLTPNQYLQEARLLEARHLLERRMFHSVDKVAEAVGFTSGRYFATIYRRRFGISPKSYV